VAPRPGLRARVDDLDAGQILEVPRLQQLEHRGLAAVEQHQVGLHDLAAHLDPVVVLAGLGFVHSPDRLPGLRIEAKGLEDRLVDGEA